MKRITTICAGLLLALVMAGCTPATQTKVANAVLTASTVIKSFQAAEINSHQQGLISEADHQFIQLELGNVAVAGKALDSCVASATNVQGDLVCLSTAQTAIDQIDAAGGDGINSAQAKRDFKAAMAEFKISLATIQAVIGGAK